MKIDYIICSHNELPYLKLMLWAINLNQEILDVADIKVFDSSDDGTKEWCEKHNIWCETVTLPDVWSTWNYGASITQNPLIVFSTCDHIPAPDFWRHILKQQEIHPEIYAFTGSCLDNGKTYPHEDNVPEYTWPTPGLQLPTERRWFKRDCGDNWKDFSYEKFLIRVMQIGYTKDITRMETSYCPLLTT